MEAPAQLPSKAPIRAVEPTAEDVLPRGEASSRPSVPDHKLFQRIGAGAYGEVWLARNLATGALRAVKIVYRSTFADERPFNREFEGIKKFDAVSRSHPSQLALFHVGRNDSAGYFYYVMELADDLAAADARLTSPASQIPHDGCYKAHTLRADLEQGRLPAARALQTALALTEALAHLHAHNLIHRDVKPSNIIFVGGRPKLADIGLVTDASDSRSIVGTEGYLAPEGPGTPAADIFALGKVLYEALTGLDRREFPNFPTELREWPDAALVFEINEIVLKASAANARDRYPSTDLMLADLKLLYSGKSLKRRHSIQRGWAWTWKAALPIAVMGLVFLLIRSERSRRGTLTKFNISPMERSGTTNAAAWEARGRAIMMAGDYTPSGLTNACLEFERALSVDPDYVTAWIGLSSRLFCLVRFGYAPGREVLARAQRCAEKALKLDPNSAGGYFMLGECVLALDYDLTRAEPLFRKAVQLAPDSAELRRNLAAWIWPYGRFEEAEKILKQAIHEIPWDVDAYAVLGKVYGGAARFPEALTTLGDAIQLKPDYPEPRFERAAIFWATNHRLEAARDWLRFVELDGFVCLTPTTDAATLKKTLTESGPDDFLRQLIELLEQGLARGQFVSAYDLARLHAAAGNRIRALDYLEKAVDEHRSLTLAAKVNPAFKGLQDEPRYHAVLRRLKLEK